MSEAVKPALLVLAKASSAAAMEELEAAFSCLHVWQQAPDGRDAYAIDCEVLAALGPQGTLVNIARGSVVDEAALIAALDAGTLGAAALDVFADEPRVPNALRERSNVVLTAHAGSLTVETRYAMGKLAIDNLVAHFAGKPLLTPVSAD